VKGMAFTFPLFGCGELSNRQAGLIQAGAFSLAAATDRMPLATVR
jgi:hypothetical protein